MLALFQDVGGTDAEAFAIEAAVGEASANMYRGGYRHHPEAVDLVCSTTNGTVEMVLTDYDPLPREGDALNQRRGRYLIGRVMDPVEFNDPMRHGHGVSIRMVKTLRSNSPADPHSRRTVITCCRSTGGQAPHQRRGRFGTYRRAIGSRQAAL